MALGRQAVQRPAGCKRAAPAQRKAVMVRAAVAAPQQSADTKVYIPHVPGPIIMNGQVLHSLTAQQLDVVRSLEDGYLQTNVVPMLKPVDKCWQPSDFLPPSEDADFFDKVQALRERTKNLPDEYLVVFIGDMITEEALPTYMHMVNTLDGVRDETGASQTPWAQWTRQWVAEENRHGDLMNKYMYLTGRVNMKAIEVTVQNLIGSGMDPKTENNPYLGFCYTSFQERATKVSHGNTARHALEYGDAVLAKICGTIAADEGRHEIAYQKIMEGFFERDPSGTMVAFGNMMRKQILMPAHMMNDGQHETKTGRNLFADFSSVAERTGTYTAMDYANIVEYLLGRWHIADKTGLTGEAAAAQDYVIKLPDRIRRLAEKTAARKAKGKKVESPFSWVFDRPVVTL